MLSSMVWVCESTYLLLNLEGSKVEYESSAFKTSWCDCNDMRTASAEVTHPEQARQSVKEICAGGRFSGVTLSSVVTS